MRFLIEQDYNTLIKADKLDVIIGDDCTVLRAAESAAQSEVESYLSNRFDTEKVFNPVMDYSETAAFDFLSRIYLDAEPFSITKTYVAGELTKKDNKVYSSDAGSVGAFDPSDWTLIGTVGHYYLDAPAWSKLTAYTTGQIVKIGYSYFQALSNNTNIDPFQFATVWNPITGLSGEIPETSTYWISGDSRSQHIVMRLIDITLYHLHSRINPRNIPEFRIARRDEAIQWLRDLTKGTVTPNLPLIEPEQGNNIEWGNLTPRKNQSY